MAGTPGSGSTVDYSASKPERRYSHKYVEYLYNYYSDSARRLKKAVPGPQEGYVDPCAINGVPVPRKGRGIPPTDSREAEFRVCPRRHVANMSYACSEGLLDMSRPVTADAVAQLHIDETRSRAVLRQSGKHNMSSLVGCGAIVTAEPLVEKPRRAPGSANPGRGLSHNMSRSLAFGEAAAEEDPQQRRVRLLYTYSEPPCTPDNILRHRMSDPEVEATPAKFDAARCPAPTTEACRVDERRAVFYDSLRSYARNKMRAEFGSLRMRQSSGLRTLAGMAC